MSAISEIPTADRLVGQVIVRASHVELYRDGQEVLRDVNLEVAKGEILGIVGPNGGGKTSLLRLILGLDRPSSGEIELFGEPVSRFREWHRVGYIPQHAVAFDPNFPATVRETVLLGRVAPRGVFHWFRPEDFAVARAATAPSCTRDLPARCTTRPCSARCTAAAP